MTPKRFARRSCGALFALAWCSFSTAAVAAAPAPSAARPEADPTARFEEATDVFSVEIPVTVVGRDG